MALSPCLHGGQALSIRLHEQNRLAVHSVISRKENNLSSRQFKIMLGDGK